MKKRSTILYIDDDEDDQEAFAAALHKVDGSVDLHSACNGAEGIEKLSRLHVENETPRLIVLDINMPRLNGKETILQLQQEKLLDIAPIVIFSTSNNAMDSCFFQRYNVKMYTKPTSFNGLVTVIRELMECA